MTQYTVVRTRADEKQRAALEPPVTRAKSRHSTRAAFHKVVEACSRPQLPKASRWCSKDRLLTMTVGAGLMVGSLLIALLLLVVVGYREDRNGANVASATQAKNTAYTEERGWQPPLRKARAQVRPSANSGMKQKHLDWREVNRTNPEHWHFSTSGERA
ncbi:uncharacterized protein LOC125947169 [Dermacentor silvarum]|uniref:uncharacterized protein LOC125947169 n=1 Tax=Dermacentor silvarum TaxID=543639 RepID=UPI0021019E1A|nr:uncharacterized protein LOC125947169 [Dermacentor silvarum]